MIERVEFDKYPPEPVRLAFYGWLRHHGIDPDVVALPGWIERDAARRLVRCVGYHLDERGAPMLTDDRTDVVRYVQRYQLEAEPSPFPTVQDES